MKQNDNYFSDIYNNIFSTVEELIKTRQALVHFDYLNNEENSLLKHTLHLLYKKLIIVNKDIEYYKDSVTTDFAIPNEIE